jgi:hypothetical protein
MSTTQSPRHIKEHNTSPTLHRDNVLSADATPPTQGKAAGMNMAGYEEAIIEVLPKGASGNPSATIYWWSDAAGAWISDHTPVTFAAAGAGVEWTAVVQCKHRRMFVALGGTFTGGIDVYVAGHRNVVEGT